MITFPNCKINLGLHIVRKREDGYHDVETVFYPIAVHDALEIVNRNMAGNSRQITGHAETAVVNHNQDLAFNNTGLPVQGAPENNLCIKAYHLLKKDFPQLPPIQMHLHKVIPMGAGLGGGSSDGAFTLRLLNDTYHLELSQQKLLDYALQLGSDCPFFIIDTPCLATGRGEQLTPISLDLSGYSFLLVHPGVHINTGWAFSQLSPASSAKPLEEIVHLPVTNWRTLLKNDFETPVCQHHPELAAIKEKLYHAGALYASMSGSGSCFYGIFPKKQVPAIDWPAGYAVFQTN